ncbi:MAG: DUF2269 family protein [Woeseiaceae bacterium]
MSYLLLKFVHVASAILFVGNITTGVFWGMHAHKNRDFRQIASTFEGIMRADRLFTTPGVIGLVVSGIVAAIVDQLPILGTGWILWGIVLLVIAGTVFGRKVAPLQREIVKLARAADSSEASWQGYEQVYRGWARWGLVALIAPAVAVLIMVMKPQLPAF